MNNEIKFDTIAPVENMKEAIKEVFDVELDISGGWGYDNTTAVVVNSMDMPLEQFVHMFATIRANVEMNLVQDENEQYGGINANFEESKKFEIENKTFDVLTFKITAMKDKEYAKLIQEYKDGYGKEDFDITAHFKRREEVTITRSVDYWFLGLEE